MCITSLNIQIHCIKYLCVYILHSLHLYNSYFEYYICIYAIGSFSKDLIYFLDIFYNLFDIFSSLNILVIHTLSLSIYIYIYLYIYFF